MTLETGQGPFPPRAPPLYLISPQRMARKSSMIEKSAYPLLDTAASLSSSPPAMPLLFIPFFDPNRVIGVKLDVVVVAKGEAVDPNGGLIRSGADGVDGCLTIESDVEPIVPGQPLVGSDNQTFIAVSEINEFWR